MSKHIKVNHHSMQKQQGAVAIIVAICLTLLVGMLGLVLDLGHLYVAKTELQNAADSASLSGAKELNGGVTGIASATTRAIEAAGKNNYDLNSNPVVIDASHIWVGSCPSDGCMVPISSVTTDALAGDKTFVKVDTGLRTLSTWFIQVLPGVASTTQTFGLAVAGKYAVDITPIAICEQPDPGTTHELGFERGVSYRVSEANPLGPGTMFWIDPESNVPGVCPVTSTNATRPYICAGKTGFTPIVGDTVNTNTGISTPQLSALDSRFGDYTPQNQCDPATAPPDSNVKEYRYNNAGTGSPNDWMGTNPVQQTITFVERANVNNLCSPSGPCRSKPYTLPRVATDYGVLWAGYRRSGATVADWPALYSGNTATSYPEPSPYAQTSGDYFTAPPVAYQPGKPGRRVLNMVIIDCTTAGGVCRPAPVLGVGRFLMQRRSNVSGDRDVFVEFGGLLPTPLPTSDIKLYR
jgi:hypothetical protein